MALAPRLTNTQRQRLALTPVMRQNLDILARSAQDLERIVDEAVEDNPLLTIGERASGATGANAFAYATRTAAQPESIGDLLRRQLSQMRLSDECRGLANYLTGELDDSGYLRTPTTEIAEDLGLPLSNVEEAIAAIQCCEPAGIGASDLGDCIRLQLLDRGIDRDTVNRLIPALEPISTHDWVTAARLSGLPQAELISLADLISGLTPSPAANLDQAPVQQLIPELQVERQPDGEFRISLIDGILPDLAIDVSLLERSMRQTEAHNYSKKCKARAEEFLRALEFRGQTLLRVGQALVSHQLPFFRGETSMPVPLSRVEMGAELDLHGTTVGRAITGKSLDWNGRSYPLEFFFPRPLGDTGFSVAEVQHRIRHIVSTEVEGSVFSDEAIATMLKQEGVDIARRTVAKYRKCLSIPPSNLRRRNLASARRRDGLRVGTQQKTD